MSLSIPLVTRYAGAPTVPGYTVDRFLGRGSTGVVWAATDTGSGERVALKIVEIDGPEGVDMALVDREEALGRRVPGAHLVRVRGRALLEDGRLALVMRLAGGGSLRDVVAIRGALPLGEVVTALTPLATALSELHEAGVVHVDVAPGNVLFTTDGRPLLADLSSAWLEEDGWPQKSLGTSGFAPPEVVLGHPPVPPSDVWSLGALAWYARTGGGMPPSWVGDLYWGGGVGPIVDSQEEECGTLADVTAAVGPELTPLLVRMLAQDADVRPTAAEVALALYRAATPEPVGLVGYHPDPGAAVTTRIRREAAETRSRSELREVEREEERQRRRAARHRRIRRVLVPWRLADTELQARRPGTARPVGSAGLAGSMEPRARPSWRLRAAMVATAGLVLAAGMLGLLRLTGGPLEVATTQVAETSAGVASPTDPAMTPLPRDSTAEAWSESSSPAGASSESSSPAEASSESSSLAAASSESSSLAAKPAPSSDEVTRDPVVALQSLADRRAAALVAADPVLLVGAEPAGSRAHEIDRRTIDRLREQRQHYLDLAFTVRSAEVVSASPGAVVLLAVVDRAAYQVVSEGGWNDSVGPAPGTPLRYMLTPTEGVWRLTEVGPP
jgi:hypothetical protein